MHRLWKETGEEILSNDMEAIRELEVDGIAYFRDTYSKSARQRPSLVTRGGYPCHPRCELRLLDVQCAATTEGLPTTPPRIVPAILKAKLCLCHGLSARYPRQASGR